MTPTIRIPDNLSRYAVTMSATVAITAMTGAFWLGWRMHGIQVQANAINARVTVLETTSATLADKLSNMDRTLVRIETILDPQQKPIRYRMPEASAAATGNMQ